MRDHLLGCQAFLPPEGFQASETKPFSLGIPERVHRECAARYDRHVAAVKPLEAFETGDHTPPEMQADFPREYDLMTMLNETASRLMFPYHKGMLVPEEYETLSRFYDAELQRLCGIK